MLDEDWGEGEELFVDRDGDLFHHLLAFMRSGTRPVASTLQDLREALGRESSVKIKWKIKCSCK